MKFFIDTANIEEIKKAVDMGMVDGVTTNPSLIAREKKPFVEIIKEICKVVDGPISAEVIALDAEGMVREGRELAAHDQLVEDPVCHIYVPKRQAIVLQDGDTPVFFCSEQCRKMYCDAHATNRQENG